MLDNSKTVHLKMLPKQVQGDVVEKKTTWEDVKQAWQELKDTTRKSVEEIKANLGTAKPSEETPFELLGWHRVTDRYHFRVLSTGLLRLEVLLETFGGWKVIVMSAPRFVIYTFEGHTTLEAAKADAEEKARVLLSEALGDLGNQKVE